MEFFFTVQILWTDLEGPEDLTPQNTCYTIEVNHSFRDPGANACAE